MKRAFVLFACVVFAVFANTKSGIAREKILLFKSDIEVKKDGSMLVTETIRVKAEGRQIRRGIYRDFPVRYRHNDRYWRYVGFSIKAIQRDGKREPYHTERQDDYERIYIGQKDIFLRNGIYEYKITYKTTRQLRFFEDFDELYWNVNGTKWQFEADKVIARVTLPKAAEILQEQAFTGRYGQRRTAYDVVEKTQNSITYETTSRLQRYEGLTIAVAWQKGVVPPPSALSAWFWRIWDNIGLVVLFVGTFAILLYFWETWNRIGRDPENGIVIPLFGPPKGLSAAAVSFIHYRRFKGSGGASLPFVAALISLAVKERIKITNFKDTLKVIRHEGAHHNLPSGEAALYKGLLGSRQSVKFNEKNGTLVQTARTSFRSAITDEHGDVFFKDNLGPFAIGAAISIIILVAFFFLLFPAEDMLVVIIVTLLSAFGGSLVLSLGLRRLGNTIPGGSSTFVGILLTVVGVLLSAPAIAIPVVTSALPFWVPVSLAIICAANVMFYTLLRAPTQLGQKISDEIEGFKLYLSVAEADRMNMKGAPDVNQQVFERFLPYAIGLGVEKPWSTAFEGYMAKVGKTEAYSAYSPTWYNGSSRWDMRDLGVATAGIVAGVSAGMAQATPPSSSGSSGGGGFSGGGGGGGGGGGW